MNGFQHLAEACAWLGDQATRPQIALVGVFVVAGLLAVGGLYKLRHPRSAALSAVRFGLARRASRELGYTLGIAELAAAALLVAWPLEVAFAGAALALVLSLGFVVVISRALAHGETFPCNCISESGDPVSVATLARALGMVAAVCIAIAAMVRFSASLYVGIESSLAAAALALVVVGASLTAQAALQLRRHHQAITRDIDWEWLIAANRVQQPARQEGP